MTARWRTSAGAFWLLTATVATGLWATLCMAAGANLWPGAGLAAGVAHNLRSAAGFVFLGALFVSNAAFNTLGRPHFSTVLNWGRATLGTMPFVAAGAHLGGAEGVLAGSMLGGVGLHPAGLQGVDPAIGEPDGTDAEHDGPSRIRQKVAKHGVHNGRGRPSGAANPMLFLNF